MLNIINNSTDPFFNLALEEYFLTTEAFEDHMFILWQNEPTIVIGRHQNTAAEVNQDYITKHNIHVVRRLSGGGAVYHDLGNLNYSYISLRNYSHRNNFAHFALPIVQALRDLGLDAEFTGRNDITVGGRKVSGNAQYFFKDRILHHGTLLFDTDMAILGQALHTRTGKFASKAVQSATSPVVNIRDCLTQPLSLSAFKEHIAQSILMDHSNSHTYILKPQDMQSIADIANRRYRTWDWNYGASPPCSIHHEAQFPGGTIHIYLNLQGGLIQTFRIYGDFFANDDIQELEQGLLGVRYNETTLAAKLEQLEAERYFYHITAEDLLHCLFPAGAPTA